MKQNDGIISTDLAGLEVAEDEDIAGEVEYREVIVTTQQHGLRLDKALSEILPEFTEATSSSWWLPVRSPGNQKL